MKLSFLSCYKCEALQEKLSCPLSLHPRKFPCQKCRWNKKAIHSHFFLQSLRSQKLAAMPSVPGQRECKAAAAGNAGEAGATRARAAFDTHTPANMAAERGRAGSERARASPSLRALRLLPHAHWLRPS